MSMLSNPAQTNARWSANVALRLQPNRREASRLLAALRDGAMVKLNAPIRVGSFLLWAACGVFSQNPPATDLLLGSESPNAPEMQRQEMRALPDAPEPVGPPTQAARFLGFVDEVGSPLRLGAGAQPSSLSLFQSARVQNESAAGAFLDKYLHSPSPKHDQPQSLSTGGSFVSRTCYSASRVFFTRDDSGKARLNTSYFLEVLTSAAIHTASRPYWARSTSATFDDFGSSIGGDAGINVFHEFEPGIRQIVRGHIPRFVSRIQLRLTQGRTQRDASTPAR